MAVVPRTAAIVFFDSEACYENNRFDIVRDGCNIRYFPDYAR